MYIGDLAIDTRGLQPVDESRLYLAYITECCASISFFSFVFGVVISSNVCGFRYAAVGLGSAVALKHRPNWVISCSSCAAAATAAALNV